MVRPFLAILLALAPLTNCKGSTEKSASQSAPAAEREPVLPADDDASPPRLATLSSHPAATTDAGAPPPGRRLEPLPDWNPTHATVRLLRKIGERTWSLPPLIDPNRGLLLVRNSSENGRPKAVHYCGEELDEGMKKAMLNFEYLVRRLNDGQKISCTNVPGPPKCISPMMGEYEPYLIFHFGESARGIVLEAIFELDIYTGGTPDSRKTLRRARGELETARKAGCPK